MWDLQDVATGEECQRGSRTLEELPCLELNMAQPLHGGMAAAGMAPERFPRPEETEAS
jgi:hypothetical protein